MKKITLTMALISLITFAFGQRTVLNGIEMNGGNGHYFNTEAVTDTLAPLGIVNATGFTLYTAPNGGYLCGVNGYSDPAKAQQFLVNDGYKVEGAIIWVGAKEIVGTPGTLSVAINKMNGTATHYGTGSGTPGPGPGTTLTSTSKSMSLVDTTTSLTFGSMPSFIFPAPVNVYEDYAVVVDLTQMGDDTLGIVSCVTGDAQNSELSFEKWDNNTWNTLRYSWTVGGVGIDVDMAIFPLADLSTIGFEDASFINGIKIGQNYPNPVVDVTEVRFELQNGADVTAIVSDMNGRIVRMIEAGQLEAGQHNMRLDLSDLSAGSYFFSLQAGKNRLAMKMQVTR